MSPVSMRSGAGQPGEPGERAVAARIVEAARRWKRDGNGCDLSGLGLSSPAFDLALERAADKVIKIIGDGELPGFYAALQGEAMTAFVQASGDEQAGGRVRLFAIPMCGKVADMEAVIADDAKFGAFRRSFWRSGIAAEGTRLVLVRRLLDPMDLATIMPGGMRRALVEIAPSLLAPGDAQSRLADDDILAILGCEPESPRREGGMLVGSRILVGAHFSAVAADEAPIDFLGCLCPVSQVRRLLACADEAGREEILRHIDAGEDQTVLAWLDGASAAFGSRVVVEHPQTWDSCMNALISFAFRTAVDIGKAYQGVAAGSEPDVLHVHVGEEWATMQLEYGGQTVGPVLVQMNLAACNMDVFNDLLRDEAAEVVQHDSLGSLPGGSRWAM